MNHMGMIECLNCCKEFIPTKHGGCCAEPKRKYQSLGDRILSLEIYIGDLRERISALEDSINNG